MDSRRNSYVALTLAEINQHFEGYADNGVITKARFMEAMGEKRHSFMATRFFDCLDTDSDGVIDFDDLNRGVTRLLTGDIKSKIGFIFNLYDSDNDGVICFSELHKMVINSSQESGMKFDERKLLSLTNVLLTELDNDGDRQLSRKDMECYWNTDPQKLASIINETITWLQPSSDIKGKAPEKLEVPLLTRIRDNPTLLTFFVVLFLTNLTLAVVNMYMYRHSNWSIIVARGTGICLDADACLIILLPLRKLISYLRMTELRKWLPLDDNIYIHIVTAVVIIILSALHTIGHLGNAVSVAEDFNVTVAEFLFTTKADIGWIAGLAPLTGVVLVVVLIVLVSFSLPCIRRHGRFEVFHWSHKLYYLFYILCILHTTHFWKWFLAPGLLFLYETVRANWYVKGQIEDASLLSSDVVQLMVKPKQPFRFTSGDYVYICVPSITSYEWHPFTISSSPHMKDTFTLHIRSVGSWTKTLKNRCAAQKESLNTYNNPGRRTVAARLSMNSACVKTMETERYFQPSSSTLGRKSMSRMVYDDILISGPFGTPCREIFDTSHPILIGAGIGVTPFASILQSIFFYIKRAAMSCPKCEHRWFNWDAAGRIIDRVDFVWINRDYKSFEWFAELLFKLEQEFAILDLSHVFKMHLFVTGTHAIKDLRGLGIQVALDVDYQKRKFDCLTGLSTKAMAGRPNFDEIFNEISENSPFDKKVFVCGPPALTREVKLYSQKYGFKFSQEYF